MEGSYPIAHWSYSSLISYLRNPLAWYKRYVEKIYDTPGTPAAVVGRAGHKALEHFYEGLDKDASIDLGLEYLRNVPDFEINFGKAETRTAQNKKRLSMEKEYLQAIGYYLKRAPRHEVIGVEAVAKSKVEGVPIPIKAISDLVIVSKKDKKALDIVDHKFVDTFSGLKDDKPLFVLQAIFNYFTVTQEFKKPVKSFHIYECKKRKNKDGSAQLRKYTIDFDDCKEEFATFHRLLSDATEDIRTRTKFLPNPSDMFEGKNSFEIYRMGLLE